MQQSAVLESTLATANDHDMLSAKAAQVVVLAGMRHESRGQIAELGGTMRIVEEADCHHHSRALHLTAVGERQKKAIVLTLDPRDVGLIDVGYHMLLKPKRVVDERINRLWIALVVIRFAKEAF